MKAMLMTAPGGPEVLQAADDPDTESGPERSAGAAARGRPQSARHQGAQAQHVLPERNCPRCWVATAPGRWKRWVRASAASSPATTCTSSTTDWARGPGSYAEYTLVHEDYAARKPAKLSMVEAAAVPLVLITAWEALVDRVGLKEGETVLIHAGAGGVGHIAIQLARHLGAHVATTVSGADKARFVESLGAERAIDYKSQDFVEQTLAWTDGKGADVVFDTVGGAVFCQSFGAVRLYGRLATLLSTVCEMPQINKARLRNIVVGYEQMTMPLFLGKHESALRADAHPRAGRASVRRRQAQGRGEQGACRSRRRGGRAQARRGRPHDGQGRAADRLSGEAWRAAPTARLAPRVYDYVVVGAGSAGCALAARLTEGGEHTVAAARGGQERPAPVGARSAGRRQAAQRRTIRLEDLHRTRSGTARQQAVLAERPDPRRIELGQRARLRSRPPGEVRRVACGRLPGLGLCGRAALFQEGRGLPVRQTRVRRGRGGPIAVRAARWATRFPTPSSKRASRSGIRASPTTTPIFPMAPHRCRSTAATACAAARSTAISRPPRAARI